MDKTVNKLSAGYIWTEKYSVVVADIDKQHQRFFEIANEIIDLAKNENIFMSELLFKITNLSNYAVYHLLTEENIFKRYNYSNAAEHIAAHNIYREKMKEFVAEVEKEGANTKDLALEMAEFAGEWLTEHIIAMDQKYAGFMRENGIK